MTPAARIQAAIELLDDLQTSLDLAGPSLEILTRRYFAKRRYAGSSDRRQVREITYQIMRDYHHLTWQLEVAAAAKPTGRNLLIASLVQKSEKPATIFNGQKYAPDPLGEEEHQLTKDLKAAGEGPAWARLNCPRWLFAAFGERFGAAAEEGLAALNDRAPMVLRANRLKGDRGAAAAVLQAEGIATAAGQFVSEALIVEAGTNIVAGTAYREGWVELQDEGSQLAAILVDAQPGMTVIDLCAGAGGKTLALAARMQNEGRLVAADISAAKLSELKKRAERAGATNIEIVELTSLEKADRRREQLDILKGVAERVLVDAPCSGSGTWRRQPELRLRYNDKRVKEISELQRQLLGEAAALVAPGGRLIYVTCSLLAIENEDQCSSFLDCHAGWRSINWQQIWLAQEPASLPDSLSYEPACLQLAPHLHGTDGFFVGIFEAPSRLPRGGPETIMGPIGRAAT
jgi:16S rRNA (cytosine967-C5)-methyltransferase